MTYLITEGFLKHLTNYLQPSPLEKKEGSTICLAIALFLTLQLFWTNTQCTCIFHSVLYKALTNFR